MRPKEIATADLYRIGVFLRRYGVRRKRLGCRKTAVFLSTFHRNIFTGTFTRSWAGEYCDVDRALVIEVDSFNPPVTPSAQYGWWIRRRGSKPVKLSSPTSVLLRTDDALESGSPWLGVSVWFLSSSCNSSVSRLCRKLRRHRRPSIAKPANHTLATFPSLIRQEETNGCRSVALWTF